MTTRLRWLHFTDLHIGQKDQGLWPSAKQAILDDLRRVTKELGPWEVVLFTGDLAFSGKASEYEKLDAELKEIWGVFEAQHPGRAPKLLAVPGNHDLARPKPTDAFALQLLNEPKAREALWSNEKNHIKAVQRWFSGYTSWWQRCALKPTTNMTPGLLPGEFAWVLEKDGIRFGFVGLSTAFTHIFDVEEGSIWIDPRQLNGACGGNPIAWARDQHDFSFLLTHHPPGWLSPEAARSYDASIAPPGSFTAHLCGHLHESFATQRRAGRGASREIWQGGSLFGLEKTRDGKRIERKHGYTAGELEVLADGSARTTLWPRLGVKRQDGSWAITADVSYLLRDDLLRTDAEPVEVRRPITRRSNLLSPPAPLVLAAPLLPKSWRDSIESSPLWPGNADPAALARAKRAAAEIADACWEQYGAAERELPDDLWRDDDLPRRTLARLEALVPPNALSPQETAFLLAAPFVREGLFAAGACWMAPARPLDLKYQDSESLARKLLEEMHAARPDLVRRMEELEGPAHAAVGYWLMTRALRSCPQLWEGEPMVPHARTLVRRFREAIQSASAGEWMAIHRLVQLTRHVGVSPDAFQAEETVDRDASVVADGVPLRLSALARLLCAAGTWALDLRLADDLVADHAGRDGFCPRMARDAIRTARWVPGDDVYRLVQRCADPVVDFVLRDDLLKRAEQTLRRLAQNRDERPHLSYGLLDRLPPQLRADISIGTHPDGRPRFRLPHVRFQLDHNQIRELLMGEQLYGDPGLAVRELYQNALDACRYRKARVDYLKHCGKWLEEAPYEGRIAFRQDVDEEGRAYIECEDNGVGMTAGILEHVFAVAGKRFKDMPEYVEERARWDACKNEKNIELHLNSRFGIGVLSYFMLADEVRVWTRRFEPSGQFGANALVLHISSAGGLFRVEERYSGVMPSGGTRVRLYLNKTSHLPHDRGDGRKVSCQEVLGRLLWVAEFATTAEEGQKEPLSWQPGVLTRNGQALSPSEFVPTDHPDVWWAKCEHPAQPYDSRARLPRSGDNGHEANVPLLVDGILTTTKIAGILVNLRAGRCRQLSVDRERVLVWESAWVESELIRSLPRLLNWEGLTMMFLWDLATHRPPLARRLIALLSDRDITVPMAARENRVSLSYGGKDATELGAAGLRDLGCLPADQLLLPSRHGLSMEKPDNLFAAWRANSWFRVGAIPAPPEWHVGEYVDGLAGAPVDPGDCDILGLRDQWDSMRREVYPLAREHLVIYAMDLWWAAAKQKRSVFDVVDRVRVYEFLGYELGLEDVDCVGLEDLRRSGDELLPLLEAVREDYGSRSDVEILPLDVLALSLRFSVSSAVVRDRLDRLASLGVRVAPCDAALLDTIGATRDHFRALSRDGYGRAPWLSGVIPAFRFLRAWPPIDTPVDLLIEGLRRFEPLGIQVPEVELARLLLIGADDLLLLTNNLWGFSSPIQPRISFAHIAQVVVRFKVPPSEAWRRLKRLEWTGIELPPIDPGVLDTLDGHEPRFSAAAQHFDTAEVSASQIAAAASRVGVAAALHFASLLGILSTQLCIAFEALDPNFDLNDIDVLVLSSFEAAPGQGPEIRRRRGRAFTRFKIWKLSDADLDAAIDYLRPVIDHIIQEPKP